MIHIIVLAHIQDFKSSRIFNVNHVGVYNFLIIYKRRVIVCVLRISPIFRLIFMIIMILVGICGDELRYMSRFVRCDLCNLQ